MERVRSLVKKLQITPTSIVLVGILGLAFQLRLHNLDRLSIWIDEGYTIWKTHQPFSSIFFLNRIDTVPPLYYYLLKCWLFFSGESDYALRLLSVVLGTLTLVVVYFCARILMDRRAGLLAAFLLGISSFHIQYSQEARSYSLLTFLFSLTMLSLLLLLRSQRFLFWAAYVVCGALLMYTHGLSLIYLVCLNIYFLSHKETWKPSTLRNWLIAGSVILVCFLPWLHVYAKEVASFQFQTTLPAPSLNGILNTTVLLASFPPPTPRFLPSFLQTQEWALPLLHVVWAVTFLFLFVSPFMASVHRHLKRLLTLYLLLFLPGVFIFLFSLTVRSIYLDRLFVVCAVPLSLILAANIELANKRSRFLIVLLLALYSTVSCFCIYAYYQRDWKEDYLGATNYVLQHAQPGDVVVFVAHVGQIVFDWYSEGNGQNLIKMGLPEDAYTPGEPEPGRVIRSDEDLSRLNSILHKSRGYWLIKNHAYHFDPDDLAEKWMDAHMVRMQKIEFAGIQVLSYRDR